MKSFKFLAIILLTPFCAAFAQSNRSNGTIQNRIGVPALFDSLQTTNLESFRFRPGLITQLDRDDSNDPLPFDFLRNSQWLSMGRITTANQTLYGFRAQRAGRGLLIGYKGGRQANLTDAPTIGSAVIEWVGNGSIPSGDLTFATSLSATSAAPTQVMRMRADATCLISTGGSVFNSSGIFGLKPKLEIFSNDFSPGLLVSSSTSNEPGVRFSNTGSGLITGLDVNSNVAGLFNSGLDGCIGIQVNTIGSNFIELTPNPCPPNQICLGTSNSINYGIYSTATGFNAKAGFFNGQVVATGGVSEVSDASLKQNVVKETNMLARLTSLNPVNYTFKQEKDKTGLVLPTTLQHGFIAQELEKVFPELVSQITNPIFNDKNEMIGRKQIKAVNYTELISVLVAALTELNTEVQTLKQQNQPKTVLIDKTSKLTQAQQDRLVMNSYMLEQNRPNPTDGQTTIGYALPENERNASILLLNLSGQLIKEYKLNEAKGSIIIDGSGLPKGVYLYSLVSNNLEIATKKMIIK